MTGINLHQSVLNLDHPVQIRSISAEFRTKQTNQLGILLAKQCAEVFLCAIT